MRTLTRRVLPAAAAAAAAAALATGLALAPTDAVQGPAQRLMYVHVPAAWLAYLAFTGVLVCSGMYLARRDLAWDARAQAAAELGVGATALAIALGMLWGRPVWGVWWVWDPRLVTTAVLLLVYTGYLGIRGLSADPHLNARRAAVVGVLGFVDIPVVHFSVVWWRAVHQPPTLLQPSTDPPIETGMLVALLAGVVAFTLLGLVVLRRRTAAIRAEQPGPPPDASADQAPGRARAGAIVHAQPIHVRPGTRS